MTIEYKVGMRLWMQSSGRLTTSQYVTVEKVGRKWVQLSGGHRVEIGSRHLERGINGQLAGTLYLTREEHEQAVALQREWAEFKKSLGDARKGPPTGVTREKIAEAIRVLGLP